MGADEPARLVANQDCLIAQRLDDLEKKRRRFSFGRRDHFAVKQYGLALEQIVVGFDDFAGFAIHQHGVIAYADPGEAMRRRL